MRHCPWWTGNTRLEPLAHVVSSLPESVRQLGDALRHAARLVQGQTLGDIGIALVGMALNVGEHLTVGILYLKAAGEGHHRPGRRKAIAQGANLKRPGEPRRHLTKDATRYTRGANQESLRRSVVFSF
jgi:hypothetical protein